MFKKYIPYIGIACIIGVAFMVIKQTYTAQKSPTITIGLAGDTMLGRMVNEHLRTSLIPRMGDAGYVHIWGDTLPLLHQNDLNLINLETTFTHSTNAVPKVFNFKSDPANVQALIDAHIDVVALANNHIRDFSDEGLLETLETLDRSGIKHAGAGRTEQEARAPVISNINGIKVGIISATDNEPGWIAQGDNPGSNYFSIDAPAQLLADIRATKPLVDILIVTLHWGPNMRQRPTQPYIDAAHAMIDAGADIIPGHSAHIFQGVEVYNNKLILYDTGDFVDDYHIDPELRNDQSFLFVVTADKNGPQKLTLYPTLIENIQVNRARGAEVDAIIGKMQNLSAEFGTVIERDGAVGMVEIR